MELSNKMELSINEEKIKKESVKKNRFLKKRS